MAPAPAARRGLSAVDDIRRARPWLGTFVEIRVGGLDEADALAAVEAAYAEIAAVHRLMSFHEPDSDLSRLHRTPVGTALRIDPRTHAVLAAALGLARESQRRFDPTIAPWLVARGLLPRPVRAIEPDARADWRDVELLADARVRLRRPLWIDLGGIAKGYAVDRALDVLRAAGATRACVNAGGDLRRHGGPGELVRLDHADAGVAPQVELGDAALATSVVAGRETGSRERRCAHVDARNGRGLRARRAVSVVAARCLLADALTKVVLADLRIGARLLRRHDASACFHDGAGGWRLLGAP